MKKFILLLLLVGIPALLNAQQLYHRAKVITGKGQLLELSKLGIAVDHGEVKKDQYFISDFSDQELMLIKSKGFQYQILINNVSQHYVDQNKPENLLKINTPDLLPANCSNGSFDLNNLSVPQHFHLGSMGGFFTYAEALEIIDSMALLYPNLITVKHPITDTLKTIEGREVYFVKISDNPNVDENEPEVLYTALHHAREACSLSQLLFYMWHILENYGSDSIITSLVNTTEMYFVPVVNPDGYLYNQSTNPSGGGMWRKNRRINGGGAFGVDLNRNYGYEWGFDDTGSSPDSTRDTYRGKSGFSEPETRLMKYFTNSRNFKMAINYHTYSNLLIFPYGHINELCPDSQVFLAQCAYMSKENGFKYGNAMQTVGYLGNGDSDDWMYADTSEHEIVYAITPEAGAVSDGFWPAINRIVPICKNTLLENIKFAQLAGKLALLTDITPATITSNNTFIHYEIKRVGLENTATYTVSLIPVTPGITVNDGPKTYNNPGLLQTFTDSFSIALNGSVTQGQIVKFILKVSNGDYSIADTIKKTYGNGTLVYSNNSSTTTGWTNSSGGTWGLSTSKFVSAPSSFTDSPNGNYSTNKSSTYTLSTTIDLTNAIAAQLKFFAQWRLEQGYDFVEVQASSNNGSTWTSLCGKYTRPGTADQDEGNPLYDGNQINWVQEEIDLASYLGNTLKLRFKFKSDAGVNDDGFYFDDLKIEKITNSTTQILDLESNSWYFTPNPTSNKIQLNGLKQPSDLVISNIAGKIVASFSTVANNQELDVSQLPSGVYFINVYTLQTPIQTRKLIITK